MPNSGKIDLFVTDRKTAFRWAIIVFLAALLLYVFYRYKEAGWETERLELFPVAQREIIFQFLLSVVASVIASLVFVGMLEYRDKQNIQGLLKIGPAEFFNKKELAPFVWTGFPVL